MDPIMARKTWRTVEPIHALVYFAPEATAEYRALGLDPMAGYFASRSAAMGRVSADVVVASFFNFAPASVRAAIPAAWDCADPAVICAGRTVAAGRALERTLGDVTRSPEMAEAARLARRAALAAADHPEGRPLFAAHAGLDWPIDPHLVLWHAQMLLREFRGDGHVALLTAAGLSGLESLVLHAATGEVARAGLLSTRGWADDDWDRAVASLAERGLVDSAGAFTPRGAELRDGIEARTDQLALAPYVALGEEACDRLRELTRPWSRTLVAALAPSS